MVESCVIKFNLSGGQRLVGDRKERQLLPAAAGIVNSGSRGRFKAWFKEETRISARAPVGFWTSQGAPSCEACAVAVVRAVYALHAGRAEDSRASRASAARSRPLAASLWACAARLGWTINKGVSKAAS